MLKSKLIVLGAALMLAGCAGNSPQKIALQDASDDQMCMSQGFEKGSAAYSQCRFIAADSRNRGKQVNREAMAAALADLTKPKPQPILTSSTETECVSEGRYDGKIVTKCREDSHAKTLRILSGQ